MDTKTLIEIGLNETQAEAYILLVKNGSISPPELSRKTGEKRTNAYAILDQLEEMGLAYKKEVNKKYKYYAENPVSLERLAKKQREHSMEQERKVINSMPTLLKYFYTYSDQPGVKFYQGLEGIKDIYNDTLRVCKDMYVIRSPHDHKVVSDSFFNDYKTKRAKLGIKTTILNPDGDGEHWNEANDKKFNLKRIKLPENSYDAEVEVSMYGDKVAIISFGEEAFGTVIESPQISEAFKMIFRLSSQQ